MENTNAVLNWLSDDLQINRDNNKLKKKSFIFIITPKISHKQSRCCLFIKNLEMSAEDAGVFSR